MTSWRDLEVRLAQVWPPEDWRDVTVLLAISGGADSVALLRAVAAIRTSGQGRLWAAHFNHQLRGDDSRADEQSVVELCRTFDIACEVGRAPPCALAADSSDGLEAAARAARYRFLEATAAHIGARYVVTAHTADDQVETILHRIMRGTGIAGLAGMARARPLSPIATLMRPFLVFRRAELLAYLAELRQPYRFDASNEDLRFTRNRIRHRLLPELAQQFNPAVADALLRLGTLAAEVQAVVDRVVEEIEERAVTYESSGGVRIDAALLGGQAKYVVRELLIAAWRRQGWPLQAMGFDEWNSLAEMLAAPAGNTLVATGKRMFPGGVLADAHGGALRLERPG